MWKKMSVWGVSFMFVVLAGAGCNTMEGAGEDVERAGEEMRDASD